MLGLASGLSTVLGTEDRVKMTGFPYYVTKHQSCRERKLI